MTSRVACLFLSVASAAGLVACDDGAPEVAPPAAVETCDGLVDVGDQLVRAYVSVLEQTDVVDLTSGVDDPNLEELASIGEELDVRAAGLGCDLGALNAAIVQRTADLEANGPAAEILLDVVRDAVVEEDEEDITAPSAP